MRQTLLRMLVEKINLFYSCILEEQCSSLIAKKDPRRNKKFTSQRNGVSYVNGKSEITPFNLLDYGHFRKHFINQKKDYKEGLISPA